MNALAPAFLFRGLLPVGVETSVKLGDSNWWLIGGLVGLLVLVLLVIFGPRLVRGLARLAAGDPDQALEVDLTQIPGAPVNPGSRRLLLTGVPSRLRLVVIAAPPGQGSIDLTRTETLLDQVLPGLGGIAAVDRPHIRIWTTLPAGQDFAGSFHRLTRKPEPDDQPSRWALLAGPARAGEKTMLLGLGLWTDEKTQLGRLTVQPEKWPEVLALTS